MGQYWNGSQWVNQAGTETPPVKGGGEVPAENDAEKLAEMNDAADDAANAEAEAEAGSDDPDTEENTGPEVATPDAG